jgi:hypothetical protein
MNLIFKLRTLDIKMAKEKMDTIEKQFVEYKTKKITIDQIYLNTKMIAKSKRNYKN